MMTPTGTGLVLWVAFDAGLAVGRWWAALRGHAPGWLDAPFLAAAVAGLLTQSAFSLLASRQSRDLNARTSVALEEIKHAVGGINSALAEMRAAQLAFEINLVELTTRAMSPSAPVVGPVSVEQPASADSTRAGTWGERQRDGNLRQVLDDLVDEAGGVLALQAAYEQLGSAVSLQSLLYAVYSLRASGRIRWDDAMIGWQTELRRTDPRQPPPADSLGGS
ncbi:hypothetical protein AB0M35_20730 [Micromonospora sp. NPDC051196]|uniref:hypothetical protein n=1 Tax=Micromonospora sp. NPDC051196 TaxID=3155281 RepID=UPI0034418A1F